MRVVFRKKEPFVTTYLPVAGWKAVYYWWNPDQGGFWEPWQTSDFAFATEDEAEAYGKGWAESEEISYVPRDRSVSPQ